MRLRALACRVARPASEATRLGHGDQMKQRRAAITALGTYVPERVADQRRPREDGRHLGRVDPHADRASRQRHIVEPGTPHERARRASGQRGAAPARDRRRRAGPDHRRDGDARHALPGHGLPRAGPDRARRPGPSTSRRPAPASSTRSPSARSSWRPARHRKVMVIGADVMSLDRRLRGPHHLRAVRRRRGRGAARAARGRHRASSTSCTRWTARAACYLNMPGGGSLQPATHETVEREAALRAAAGPARLQVRGAQVHGSERGILLARNGLSGGDARPLRRRTRPTSASSRPRSTGWGCPTRRSSRTSTSTATPPPPRSRSRSRRRSTSGGSLPGHRVLLAAVGAGFTVGDGPAALVGT